MSGTESSSDFPAENGGNRKGTPWGIFPTMFMMALIGLAISLTSSALLYILFLQKQLSSPALTFKAFMQGVKANPMDSLLVGVTSIGGTLVVVLMIFLFAWKRKGITVSDYLGLTVPGIWVFLKWFGILFLFMVANGIMAQMIGQTEQSSKFTMDLIGKSQYFWLIVLAVAIAGPILEEFVMRGFLFEGLLHAKMTDVVAIFLAMGLSYGLVLKARDIQAVGESMLMSFALLLILGAVLFYALYWLYKNFRSDMPFGAVGTILLTSVFWSLLHSQYGWYNLVVIGFLGILFGVAKIRTGSLYVPIFLHAVHNGIAVMAVSLVMAEKAAGAG